MHNLMKTLKQYKLVNSTKILFLYFFLFPPNIIMFILNLYLMLGCNFGPEVILREQQQHFYKERAYYSAPPECQTTSSQYPNTYISTFSSWIFKLQPSKQCLKILLLIVVSSQAQELPYQPFYMAAGVVSCQNNNSGRRFLSRIHFWDIQKPTVSDYLQILWGIWCYFLGFCALFERCIITILKSSWRSGRVSTDE